MKKLGFVILALLAIIAVIALVAPSFLSPDAYKAEITQRVEAMTGRKLTIEGNLGIKLFPAASITADKVTLGNPAGFDDKQAFLTVNAMKIEVELMPLLSKRLVIKQFVLQEPVINMHAQKNGINNWSLANRKESKETGSESPTGYVKPKAGGKKLTDSFIMSNLELKNGTILYNDESENSHTEITHIGATMVVSSSASAVMIEGRGDWNGNAVRMKAGLGTLASLINERRADFNLNLDSELFSVSASGNYNNGAVTGKSTLKSSSLKELAAWVSPKAKPIATPAKLAFLSESELRCGNSYCSLADIRMALDEFSARGTIKINLAGSKPMLDVDLSTDKLDFNPFLPPEQHAALSNGVLIGDAMAQADGHWSSAPIDLSGLKALNANITIKAGAVQYRKIALGKTTLITKLTDGKLNANIPDAVLYNGTGTLSFAVDSTLSPPAVESKASLRSVQIEPLLKDAADMDRLTGVADMEFSTAGKGNSQREIMSGLSGSGNLKISNGTIKRVNLLDMLNNIQAAFAEANTSAKVTSFSQMSGTFTISQGVVSNRDLAMQLPNMSVSGEGNINLPAYSINYRLTPKLVRTVKDTATGASSTKEGVAVPVLVEGSLDAPKFRPDLASAVQEALQDPKKLKEQLKNSRETLKEQLKDPKDAVKNLKSLLKGR